MNISQNIANTDPVSDVDAIGVLRNIAAQYGQDMVTSFYNTMLEDGEAKQFLDHVVVQNRLSTSLLNWLTSLLGEQDIRRTPELQELQRTVGTVHARMKIPIHLVIRGASQIKSDIIDYLVAMKVDGPMALRITQLANERIDYAIMVMSQSYVKDTAANARLDEAYRLFSLDQDVAVEKEVQRASLMDWSQRTLLAMLRKSAQLGLLRLKQSEFGFWIRHRASFMFQHSAVFQDLLSEIEQIDNQLLPQLEQVIHSDDQLLLLGQFQSSVDKLTFLISELFKTLSAMENSRDPLTRTLNRRFLGSILGREVSFAIQNRSALTILLIDIDHFKAINDQYGHQTGDAVLRQVAQTIMDNVRPSDFVFRYGGEEFLIVLAETSAFEAAEIAERMREVLSAHTFDIGESIPLTVTASIGIAQHNGHPDQSYFIKAADEALYRAKNEGRNRIAIAPML